MNALGELEFLSADEWRELVKTTDLVTDSENVEPSHAPNPNEDAQSPQYVD